MDASFLDKVIRSLDVLGVSAGGGGGGGAVEVLTVGPNKGLASTNTDGALPNVIGDDAIDIQSFRQPNTGAPGATNVVIGAGSGISTAGGAVTASGDCVLGPACLLTHATSGTSDPSFVFGSTTNIQERETASHPNTGGNLGFGLGTQVTGLGNNNLVGGAFVALTDPGVQATYTASCVIGSTIDLTIDGPADDSTVVAFGSGLSSVGITSRRTLFLGTNLQLGDGATAETIANSVGLVGIGISADGTAVANTLRLGISSTGAAGGHEAVIDVKAGAGINASLITIGGTAGNLGTAGSRGSNTAYGAALVDKGKVKDTPTNGSTNVIPDNCSTYIVKPTGGTIAGCTITFPANPIDGQRLKISSNGIVTTLTTNGNGKTVVGAPAALANTTKIEWVYDSADNTWY